MRRLTGERDRAAWKRSLFEDRFERLGYIRRDGFLMGQLACKDKASVYTNWDASHVHIAPTVKTWSIEGSRGSFREMIRRIDSQKIELLCNKLPSNWIWCWNSKTPCIVSLSKMHGRRVTVGSRPWEG